MAQKKDGLGDNIWILVPLAALSIPIFAIIGENVILTSVVSGVIALIAITLAIRSLMTHRHRLKMEELEAKERIVRAEREQLSAAEDRKSTRLNSSHVRISYAVFCLKK